MSQPSSPEEPADTERAAAAAAESAAAYDKYVRNAPSTYQPPASGAPEDDATGDGATEDDATGDGAPKDGAAEQAAAAVPQQRQTEPEDRGLIGFVKRLFR